MARHVLLSRDLAKDLQILIYYLSSFFTNRFWEEFGHVQRRGRSYIRLWGLMRVSWTKGEEEVNGCSEGEHADVCCDRGGCSGKGRMEMNEPMQKLQKRATKKVQESFSLGHKTLLYHTSINLHTVSFLNLSLYLVH